MKATLVLLSFLLAARLLAEELPLERQVYPDLPVKEMLHKLKDKVMQSEQQKIAEIIGKEKASQYMKYYAQGFDSNTGAILIEGGENSWLEHAFHHGYEARQIVIESLIAG